MHSIGFVVCLKIQLTHSRPFQPQEPPRCTLKILLEGWYGGPIRCILHNRLQRPVLIEYCNVQSLQWNVTSCSHSMNKMRFIYLYFICIVHSDDGELLKGTNRVYCVYILYDELFPLPSILYNVKVVSNRDNLENCPLVMTRSYAV